MYFNITVTYPFSLFCMDLHRSHPAIGMHHRFCALAIPDLYLVYPMPPPTRGGPLCSQLAKCNLLHILWCFCKDAHQHTIACTLHWGAISWMNISLKLDLGLLKSVAYSTIVMKDVISSIGWTFNWGCIADECLFISLFISLCILRDLPHQKIPRELCSGGEPTIFLCSHVPMERFFDGTNQENSKTKSRKGTDQEN